VQRNRHSGWIPRLALDCVIAAHRECSIHGQGLKKVCRDWRLGSADFKNGNVCTKPVFPAMTLPKIAISSSLATPYALN
jgi:hypothetical protein